MGLVAGEGLEPSRRNGIGLYCKAQKNLIYNLFEPDKIPTSYNPRCIFFIYKILYLFYFLKIF